MKRVKSAKEIKEYCEAQRRFAKMMMEKCKGEKDEQYFLGRMNSAKMIKTWIGWTESK